MTEEWKPIPGYQFYEVSDQGRVRSLDRLVLTRNRWDLMSRKQKGRILKQANLRGGYLGVHLSEFGVTEMVPVSHLVTLSFVGPRPSQQHESAHWDGDRKNNVPSNLRWATSKENKSDQLRHGTRQNGQRNGNAKLTDDQVRAIKADTRPLKVVAAEYGVSFGLIGHIRQGRAWRHV